MEPDSNRQSLDVVTSSSFLRRTGAAALLSIITGCGESDSRNSIEKYGGAQTARTTAPATIVDRDIATLEHNEHPVEHFYVKLEVSSESVAFDQYGLENALSGDLTFWKEVSHKKYLNLLHIDEVQVQLSLTHCDKYHLIGEQKTRYERTDRSALSVHIPNPTRDG